MILTNEESLTFDLEAFIKWRLIDKIYPFYGRKKLKTKDFSIIGNDCIVGGIYHKFGLQFSTPTVGLFFFSQDYIKFLENLEYYVNLPLKFKEISKYLKANELRKMIPYPIGILDDVEIHFLHYSNKKEAKDKWNRRTKRIIFDNLFIVYSDGEGFREEFLDRYEKLPFANKIFISSKPRGNKDYIVFVQDYVKEQHVGDSTRNRKYEKYIDLIKWLNQEKGFLKKNK